MKMKGNNFMSATVPMSVWNNVRKYFKEHLDDRYDLQDVIRYKDPMDSYLYMVIAKEKDYPETNVQLGCRPWVVWTTWNESTQSLDGGHYDIKTYEDALSICEERRAR